MYTVRLTKKSFSAGSGWSKNITITDPDGTVIAETWGAKTNNIPGTNGVYSFLPGQHWEGTLNAVHNWAESLGKDVVTEAEFIDHIWDIGNKLAREANLPPMSRMEAEELLVDMKEFCKPRHLRK